MAPMKREASGPDWAGTLSIPQLARRWRVTPRIVRHLLGRGMLPFVQIRGDLRVPRREVAQYEQQKRPGLTPRRPRAARGPKNPGPGGAQRE